MTASQENIFIGRFALFLVFAGTITLFTRYFRQQRDYYIYNNTNNHLKLTLKKIFIWSYIIQVVIFFYGIYGGDSDLPVLVIFSEISLPFVLLFFWTIHKIKLRTLIQEKQEIPQKQIYVIEDNTPRPFQKGRERIIDFQSNEIILEQVDSMEGHQFEHWCAELLKQIGFVNVEVTPGSGDDGVDILAWQNQEKYAIQCKRFQGSVGNSAVQEVAAGKNVYRCTRAAVITNSYFTPSAKRVADANGIELWDRINLEKFLEMAEDRRRNPDAYLKERNQYVPKH